MGPKVKLLGNKIPGEEPVKPAFTLDLKRK
jgi:hypothetical protein